MMINLHDLGFSNGFCDFTTGYKQMKEKIDKLDFLKIKNFYASKDIIQKVRRQHTERKKIFTHYTFDKSLLFRIHQELLQLINKKTKKLIF